MPLPPIIRHFYLQEPLTIDIKHALERAVSDRLKQPFIENPRLEAEILLCDVLSVERWWLYAHFDYQLNHQQMMDFEAKLERRLTGEPIAYILGKKEFWSLEFRITPATLIPRPETELLVEKALELIHGHFDGINPVKVLDLATGSGVIPIAIAHECDRVQVIATDISPQALGVAIENAKIHGVNDRIKFICSDWFSALKPLGQFHLILSNPPYVSQKERDELPSEVLEYEPWSALFSEEDGMKAIRMVLSHASAFLHPGGYLLCEIGWKQGQKAVEMANAYFQQPAEILCDYGGRDRVLVVRG